MQSLGRYEIQDEVGRGGMGIVYRGVDSAIGRTVAIKTVRLSDQGTAEEARVLRDRLLREAGSAGRLSHPNIVAVYDLGQEGDIAFIVMEFVEGQSLERITHEARSPLPLDFILQVLTDTARGLDYAHSQGVVHRDIKPGNIMIQDGGSVKIADFGVAKVTWSKTMTQTGTVVGSPHYMTPEQLRGLAVSGRTDQFSLAAVAYTLLVGRRPFDADTMATLVGLILYEQPTSPRVLNPSLPVEVEKVLSKAMSKDPAARFDSCMQFAGALRRALEAPTVTLVVPRSRRVFDGRLRGLSAIAALLLLVGLVAFFLLWQHQAGEAELVYWNSVKGSSEVALFEAYLRQFPNGRFTAIAEAQIASSKRERTPAGVQGSASSSPTPTRPPVPASPIAAVQAAPSASKAAPAGTVQSLGQPAVAPAKPVVSESKPPAREQAPGLPPAGQPKPPAVAAGSAVPVESVRASMPVNTVSAASPPAAKPEAGPPPAEPAIASRRPPQEAAAQVAAPQVASAERQTSATPPAAEASRAGGATRSPGPEPARTSPEPKQVPAAPAKAPPSASVDNRQEASGYAGPRSGRLIWTGQLSRNGTLTMQEKKASTGTLIGALPGVPVKISVYPGELTKDGLVVYSSSPSHAKEKKVVEEPSRQNGWMRTQYLQDTGRSSDVAVVQPPGTNGNWTSVTLRANRSLSVVVLDWTVDSSSQR